MADAARVKRRELFRLWLGTLALAGCRPAPRMIQGRLLGASAALGHRLRTGDFPAPTRQQRVQVAVLGGGVAGLAAAWRLARRGVEDVWLYELEPTLGGNSRSQDYPESPAPWAAHYLPVPTAESHEVQALLAEMGVTDDDLCHDPEERLFYAGRWEDGLYPRAGASAEDLRQLADFQAHIDGWKGWRDGQGRKAFAIPVQASSPELAALDRESMAAYLDRHGWTSPRLRWFVEYGCRDDYGSVLAETSAWAGLHYFASRPGESQYVWPEGNARLVRHLRQPLGERFSTGSLVFRASPDGKALVFCNGEVVEVVAERFIYALPSFTRPFVLGEERQPGLTYAPWAVANVVLARRPPELRSPFHRPLSWDNVLYDSPSLGYVVATHQTLRTADHPTVLTWYRPFPLEQRRELLERKWESFRDEVLAELERVHPGVTGLVRRLDVMVLGHAMIRPTPGLIWGERLPQLREPRGRLHFAHSDLSGISLFEEAFHQGLRAAEEVMQQLPGGRAAGRRS